MKFKIGDTLYDAATIDELTVKMVLQLQQETADFFGRPLTMGELKAMSDELGQIKNPADRALHPDALKLTAVAIWAARRLKGEPVSFDEAVDFPIAKLVILPDPKDHRAPAKPRKASPRKASGRAAAAPRPGARTKTSRSASSAG